MRAMIAGAGFTAMPGRPFADRRRTVGEETGDEVPETVLVLRRADSVRETLGVARGAERPPASPPRSTWRRLTFAARG